MARSFSGGSYIQLPTANNMGDSHSFWMKTTQSGVNAGVACNCNSSGSIQGWTIFVNTAGKLQFFQKGLTDTANATSAGTVNDGAWHHVGFNVSHLSGNPYAFYVDGALAGSGTQSNNSNTNEVFRFGRHVDSFWSNYVGDIAEYAAWGWTSVGSQQLDANEFLALSKGWSPLSIRRRPLVAYVPMEEAGVRGFCGPQDVPTLSGSTASPHPRRVY